MEVPSHYNNAQESMDFINQSGRHVKIEQSSTSMSVNQNISSGPIGQSVESKIYSREIVTHIGRKPSSDTTNITFFPENDFSLSRGRDIHPGIINQPLVNRFDKQKRHDRVIDMDFRYRRPVESTSDTCQPMRVDRSVSDQSNVRHRQISQHLNSNNLSQVITDSTNQALYSKTFEVELPPFADMRRRPLIDRYTFIRDQTPKNGANEVMPQISQSRSAIDFMDQSKSIGIASSPVKLESSSAGFDPRVVRHHLVRNSNMKNVELASIGNHKENTPITSKSPAEGNKKSSCDSYKVISLSSEKIMGHVSDCNKDTNYSIKQEKVQDEIKSTTDSFKCDTFANHKESRAHKRIPDNHRTAMGKQRGMNENSEKITEIKREPTDKPVTCTPLQESELLGKDPNFKPTCKTCGKSFDDYFEVYTHTTTHVDDLTKISETSVETFSCDICQEKFIRNSLLQQHYVLIHRGEKPICCGICGESFANENDFINHTPVHPIPKPYRCHICKKGFDNKRYLAPHIRMHTGEKPYACDECDKCFNVPGSLRIHKQTYHPKGEWSHSCPICDKKFPVTEALSVHLKRHSDDRPFVCDVCGKGFMRSYELKSHATTHTGDKRYKCYDCGKSFVYKERLTSHINKVHLGERPFCCDECGKTFTAEFHLNAHKKRHAKKDSDRYPCDLCDKSFASKEGLHQHKMLHTGEKPYGCTVCEFRAATKKRVDIHYTVHTGEKPYECALCKKTFTRPYGLDKHMRVHKGEKPYMCDICGRKFIEKNNFKAHMKRMHPDRSVV